MLNDNAISIRFNSLSLKIHKKKYPSQQYDPTFTVKTFFLNKERIVKSNKEINNK